MNFTESPRNQEINIKGKKEKDRLIDANTQIEK